MAIIEVAKVPKKKVDVRDLLAELCWYYPQYTLAIANKLPAKDVKLLLKMAQRKEAEKYYNLVQIASAPHTRGGQGVKKLSEAYKKATNK